MCVHLSVCHTVGKPPLPCSSVLLLAPPMCSTASPMGCACTSCGLGFPSPGAPAHGQPCLRTQPSASHPSSSLQLPVCCSLLRVLPCWTTCTVPPMLSAGRPWASPSHLAQVGPAAHQSGSRLQDKGRLSRAGFVPWQPPHRSPVPAHSLLRAAVSPPLAHRKCLHLN